MGRDHDPQRSTPDPVTKWGQWASKFRHERLYGDQISVSLCARVAALTVDQPGQGEEGEKGDAQGASRPPPGGRRGVDARSVRATPRRSASQRVAVELICWGNGGRFVSESGGRRGRSIRRVQPSGPDRAVEIAPPRGLPRIGVPTSGAHRSIMPFWTTPRLAPPGRGSRARR